MKRKWLIVGVIGLVTEVVYADINSPPCYWGSWQMDSAPNVEPTVITQVEPATVGFPTLRTLIVNISDPGWESKSDGCGNVLTKFFYPSTPYVTWQGDVSPIFGVATLCGGTDNFGQYTANFIPQAAGQITFLVQTSYPDFNWYYAKSFDAYFNVLPTNRLGHWRFNDSRWISDEGVTPRVSTDLENVVSWNYGALRLNPDPAKAPLLKYDAFKNGTPIITHNVGTVSLWFKPDWDSKPGTTAKLLEMQEGQTQPWSLFIDGSGTLKLTISGNRCGTAVDCSSGVRDWASTNWYQIAATYDSDTVSLYINGVSVGSSRPTDPFPAIEEGVDTFCIGSKSDGTLLANGLLDELETYNFPLTATEISAKYQAAKALDTDGDGVSNIDEISRHGNPYNPDTDGDGVNDLIDPAPNDPNVWDLGNANDNTPPTINLTEPITATPL